MKNTKLAGFSALLGAAFLYSTFGVLIRYVSSMFGDYSQVAFRFLIAAIIVFIFNLYKRQVTKISKKAFLKIAALGLTFVCVVLLFTVSIINTKISNAVFLLYAGSMTSSFLIGTLIFKEKVTKIKVIAILVSLVGIAMYADALFVLSTGIIAGLASGLFDGIQNSLRKSLKGVERSIVLQYSFGIGAIFAFLVGTYFTRANDS